MLFGQRSVRGVVYIYMHRVVQRSVDVDNL